MTTSINAFVDGSPLSSIPSTYSRSPSPIRLNESVEEQTFRPFSSNLADSVANGQVADANGSPESPYPTTTTLKGRKIAAAKTGGLKLKVLKSADVEDGKKTFELVAIAGNKGPLDKLTTTEDGIGTEPPKKKRGRPPRKLNPIPNPALSAPHTNSHLDDLRQELTNDGPSPPRHSLSAGEDMSNTIFDGPYDNDASLLAQSAKRSRTAGGHAGGTAKRQKRRTVRKPESDSEELTTPPWLDFRGPRSATAALSSGVHMSDVLQTFTCKDASRGLPLELKCWTCRAKTASDGCRFLGIRLISGPTNALTAKFVSESQQPQHFDFPSKWNIDFNNDFRHKLKNAIAPSLYDTLRKEAAHIFPSDTIYRHRETDVRATCDICMTSLFSCTWICPRCGREACGDCLDEMKIKYRDFQQRKNRQRDDKEDARFLTCRRDRDHGVLDFLPMTRFHRDELMEAINAMKGRLDSGECVSTERLHQHVYDSNSRKASFKLQTDGSVVGSSWNTTAPSHEFAYLDGKEWDDLEFHKQWSLHKPFMVGGLLSQFRIPWTPGYMSEKYGNEDCRIIDCETGFVKNVKVREFFSLYGKPGEAPWKLKVTRGHFNYYSQLILLKDWPPTDTFKNVFPELFEDFHKAVPAPNYTRRDGVLNISSHFPINTIGPDVGPKMYNALAAADKPGTKGTTMLHMDMADAVNVMLYAEPFKDGKTGFAVWDLFRPCDSDILRAYLRETFPSQTEDRRRIDPIHSQLYYLDGALLNRLHEVYGIFSHRIYQRPGEAVFIPAGCAHQVLNGSDCIKVAIDFVSPENLRHCQILTREFREQNFQFERCWKEDILQLKSMLWYAWLSCTK